MLNHRKFDWRMIKRSPFLLHVMCVMLHTNCMPVCQLGSVFLDETITTTHCNHTLSTSLSLSKRCIHPFHLNKWGLNCHQCQLWEKFTCPLTDKKSLSSKGHAYQSASKPGVLGRPGCPHFKCIPIKARLSGLEDRSNETWHGLGERKGGLTDIGNPSHQRLRPPASAVTWTQRENTHKT